MGNEHINQAFIFNDHIIGNSYEITPDNEPRDRNIYVKEN